MKANFRRPVTTPLGTFSGRYPQQMRATGEGPYIAALARHVNGACEVALPFGFADVACETTVFEVEPVKSWRQGARQALAYAGQTGLDPALALFGDADYLKIYDYVRKRLPSLTLWRWNYGAWEWLSSRRLARLKTWDGGGRRVS